MAATTFPPQRDARFLGSSKAQQEERKKTNKKTGENRKREHKREQEERKEEEAEERRPGKEKKRQENWRHSELHGGHANADMKKEAPLSLPAASVPHSPRGRSSFLFSSCLLPAVSYLSR